VTAEISQFEDIATGLLSAAEACAIVERCAPNWSEADCGNVVDVFRSWAWKALDARRRDDELKQWHNLLRQLISHFRGTATSEKLGVLRDLVDESIAVATPFPVSNVLNKKHVKELLQVLGSVHGGRLDRKSIGSRLRLEQANLARVLTLALTARLVVRSARGKSACFSITEFGMSQLGSRGTYSSACDANIIGCEIHTIP
jgi:hypothetical protein